MRGWILAGFLLAAAPALAQQAGPQQQPPLGVSTNPRSMNLRFDLNPLPERPDCRADTPQTPAFAAILRQAEDLIGRRDFAGARRRLDAAAAAAVTPADWQNLAVNELMYAGAAEDPAHLAGPWNTLLTSGCYSAENVAQARSSLDVLVWVMMERGQRPA
jgi:hypothetical protein